MIEIVVCDVGVGVSVAHDIGVCDSCVVVAWLVIGVVILGMAVGVRVIVGVVVSDVARIVVVRCKCIYCCSSIRVSVVSVGEVSVVVVDSLTVGRVVIVVVVGLCIIVRVVGLCVVCFLSGCCCSCHYVCYSSVYGCGYQCCCQLS